MIQIPDYVWTFLGGWFLGMFALLGVGWFKAIGARVNVLEGEIKTLEDRSAEQCIQLAQQQASIAQQRERITKLRTRLRDGGLDHEDSDVISF